jgi:isopenicillin-N epimerase
VPTVIKFLRENNWEANQQNCHALALETRDHIKALTGLEPLRTQEWFGQMVAVRLPDSTDVAAVKTRLYDDYHIEVPLHAFQDMQLMRISFQTYNTRADADALVEALGKILSAQKVTPQNAE